MSTLSVAGSILSFYEHKSGQKVSSQHPLHSWALRHAAFVLDRFQIRPGGLTAFEAALGRPYKGAVIPYGEMLLVPQGANGKPRFVQGQVLGKVMSSDQWIGCTSAGRLVLARSARCLRTILGSTQVLSLVQQDVCVFKESPRLSCHQAFRHSDWRGSGTARGWVSCSRKDDQQCRAMKLPLIILLAQCRLLNLERSLLQLPLLIASQSSDTTPAMSLAPAETAAPAAPMDLPDSRAARSWR